MITNFNILLTTLVVGKQLWGGSDRCIFKNVNLSAGPKLSLGCGTEVSSSWLCSFIQITGNAPAAKQVEKSVTSFLSAVVAYLQQNSTSALTKKPKQTQTKKTPTQHSHVPPPRNLNHCIQSGTLVLWEIIHAMILLHWDQSWKN